MASNTLNFNIPFPDAENTIDEEMRRLQVAWNMADTILKALTDLIEAKAPVSHGHSIDQISGLATALANKMAANKTFKLSELSDVLGMADAPQGYVPVKNGDGKVFFQSAAAAIGNHQHSTGDIQGLSALIQQYIAALVDSSPAALDTLKELANALGDDPNFATTVTNALSGKMSSSRDVAAGIGIVKTGELNSGTLSLAVNKGTASDITAGASNRFPDAEAVKAAMDAHIPPGLGIGQSWQNVQASRSAGTSYQNTTGKPIVVSMMASARNGFCEGQVSADNVNWLTPNRGENIYQSDTAYYYARPIFVVPPMHYYRLTVGNNYLGISTWIELR